MEYCKECGKKLDKESKFCSKCGTKTNKEEKEVKEPKKSLIRLKEPSPKETLIFRWFFGALYLLIGIAALSDSAPSSKQFPAMFLTWTFIICGVLLIPLSSSILYKLFNFRINKRSIVLLLFFIPMITVASWMFYEDYQSKYQGGIEFFVGPYGRCDEETCTIGVSITKTSLRIDDKAIGKGIAIVNILDDKGELLISKDYPIDFNVENYPNWDITFQDGKLLSFFQCQPDGTPKKGKAIVKIQSDGLTKNLRAEKEIVLFQCWKFKFE